MKLDVPSGLPDAVFVSNGGCGYQTVHVLPVIVGRFGTGSHMLEVHDANVVEHRNTFDSLLESDHRCFGGDGGLDVWLHLVVLFDKVGEHSDELDIWFRPTAVKDERMDLVAEPGECNRTICRVDSMLAELLVCLLSITCMNMVADNAHAFGVLNLIQEDGVEKCLLNVEVLPFSVARRAVIGSEHIGATMRRRGGVCVSGPTDEVTGILDRAVIVLVRLDFEWLDSWTRATRRKKDVRIVGIWWSSVDVRVEWTRVRVATKAALEAGIIWVLPGVRRSVVRWVYNVSLAWVVMRGRHLWMHVCLISSIRCPAVAL